MTVSSLTNYTGNMERFRGRRGSQPVLLSPLQVHVDEYLFDLNAQKKSERTVKLRRDVLERFFLPFCAAENVEHPEEITSHTLRAWATALQHPARLPKPVEPGTTHMWVGVVMMWLRWLQEEEIIDKLPRRPKIQIPEREERPLTGQEMERLIRAAARFDSKGKPRPGSLRDRVVIEILCEGGLRASELVGLRLEDVKREPGGYLLNVLGKGNRPRVVPISAGIARRLQEYVRKERPETDWPNIFINTQPGVDGRYGPLGARGMSDQIKKAARRAGMDPEWIHTHLLRHSAATSLARKGMPELTLARILGHRDLTMLHERYYHPTNTDLSNALTEALLRDRRR